METAIVNDRSAVTRRDKHQDNWKMTTGDDFSTEYQQSDAVDQYRNCRAVKRSVGNLTMTASSSLIRSGARNHAVGEVQWREPRDEGRRSTELERWGPSDWIGLTGAAIRGEHWRDESVDQGQVNRQCNWSPNTASWGPWTNRRYSRNFLKIYLK